MSESVVGRSAELEQVDELRRWMRDGLTVVTLTGEPGIGKSTIWAEAVRRARNDGVAVLEARPSESEAHLAFATLADLFDPVADRVRARLAPPLARALAVALLLEEPGAEPVDQRAVGSAALGAIRVLAAEGPTLIAIDDLQWIDQPSARALDFALRRARALPVGLLASARSQGRADGPGLLEGAARAAHRSWWVPVPPVSLGAFHEIIRQQLGHSVPRPTLARIHEASGGNPFYGLELARYIGAGDPGAAPRVSPAVLELVAARMSGLGDQEQRLLLAVAIARGPSIELLARALRSSSTAVRRLIDRCQEAGITVVESGRIRFAHPIFATAVYATADAAVRRGMHARVAAVTGDPETRARHLALGTADPDVAIAAAVEAAAHSARARGAPDIAAELAVHAHRLTPPADADDLIRRGIDAAEYRLHAGDLVEARRLLGEVLVTCGPGPGRARALRVLGEIEYADTGYVAAAAAFEEAVSAAGDDAGLVSALERRLAYALMALGKFDQVRAHAGRAFEHARGSADPIDRAESLAVAAIADLLLGHGLRSDWIEEALALEDPRREMAIEMRPSLIAGDMALYVGDLSRSVRMLSELHRSMAEQGYESDQVVVASHLIWAECWRGNLGAAERHAAESIDAARRVGSPSVECLATAYAALASAWAGDIAVTRARVGRAMELVEQTGFMVGAMWAAWASAIIALAAGDARAALSALSPLAAKVEAEGGSIEPARTPFLPDAIEARIGVGQIEEAEALLRVLEQSAERTERMWARASASRCRALLLAARGDLVGAREAIEDAIAVGSQLELRLELGRSLLAMGEIDRRGRHRAAALAALTEATTIFDESGARLWAARAREAAARTQARRGSRDTLLTASERRTAELATSGLSNREIAAAMFVSPKTVEANLGRAFAKLGVRRRGQLAARLGTESTTAGTT